MSNKFIIADPAENDIQKLPETELAEIWQSKALLLLQPTATFVKSDSEKKEKYDWMKRIVRDDYPILTISFFLGLIIALIDNFFSKIRYLPKSFFDSMKTGEIISRMNDSRRIQQTISYIAGGVLIELPVLISSIAYLLSYSWKMALFFW